MVENYGLNDIVQMKKDHPCKKSGRVAPEGDSRIAAIYGAVSQHGLARCGDGHEGDLHLVREWAEGIVTPPPHFFR